MWEKSQNNKRFHEALAHKVTVAKIALLPAVKGMQIIETIYFGHKESAIS